MSLTDGFFEQSPGSLVLAEELRKQGVTPEQCVSAIARVSDDRSTQAQVLAWKKEFDKNGDDALENIVAFLCGYGE